MHQLYFTRAYLKCFSPLSSSAFSCASIDILPKLSVEFANAPVRSREKKNNFVFGLSNLVLVSSMNSKYISFLLLRLAKINLS